MKVRSTQNPNEVDNIFERGLFVHHYVKQANPDIEDFRIVLTVLVEEIEGDRTFIARRVVGESRLHIRSTFTAEQNNWLRSTYNEKYMDGLVGDMLEYINMVAEGRTLPVCESHGQELFHADVDELYMGDKFMCP